MWQQCSRSLFSHAAFASTAQDEHSSSVFSGSSRATIPVAFSSPDALPAAAGLAHEDLSVLHSPALSSISLPSCSHTAAQPACVQRGSANVQEECAGVDGLDSLLQGLSIQRPQWLESVPQQLASVPEGAEEPSQLNTSDITLLSCPHGRQRRQERGIQKRELQAAVKYGRKEYANPGRDGRTRWRYTHKGVVYITDETSRREITSWRLDSAPEVAPAVIGGPGSAHFVMVVDMSGSMRKSDVQGFNTRAEAVYTCLARDLVEPQLRMGAHGVKVSLVEMSDQAHVLLSHVAMDQHLLKYLHERKYARPHSHGHYVPALSAALQLLKEDAELSSQLFLLFLSDGAPSDHKGQACEHGFQVWHDDLESLIGHNPRPKLQLCPLGGQACRSAVKHLVWCRCQELIQEMGDLLGRERMHVHTVAFGSPSEDCQVLADIAKVLPRSSFQKLGLSADSLRTAFTSLSSSLTTARSGPKLTVRPDLAQQNIERQVIEELGTITGATWNLYVGSACLSKQQWDPVQGELVDTPFFDPPPALRQQSQYFRGVAHHKRWFAKGVERVALQCREIIEVDAGNKIAVCVGPKLVAKTAQHMERLHDPTFHRTFLRTQGEAADLARLFNEQLLGDPWGWRVNFLTCWLYRVWDPTSKETPIVEFLVEEELEGKYTKWNNNHGGVARGLHRGLAQPRHEALQGVAEQRAAEESGDESHSSPIVETSDVPQCFSHFTFVVTGGQKLVCDLQGVWNALDGFTFTDPVIHHYSNEKKNGATDKGESGMEAFFETHECSALCKRLGLHHVWMPLPD